MHTKRVTTGILAALALSWPLTSALGQTPEEMGKVHFNDPKFAGGQKACNDCHPDGRNLEEVGERTTFNIMGMAQHSLEEAINMCITYAIKGKPIPENSREMREITSYIRSLAKKGATGDK